ncbi:MAG: arylamine N-acetyltransferase family protein, partial [Geminicoccaceae bacterium]
RLGLRGEALPPTRDTIRRLQEAHLLNIPFENLDVVWKRHIQLDEQRLFNKIIGERRGGFCYELNGLMAAMLGQLGFEAYLMAAAVGTPDGGFGRDAAHACIRVALDPPILMEVGFGESILQPMELAADLIQDDGRIAYRLQREGEFWVLQSQAKDADSWHDDYRFTEQPWPLSDFQDMCDYQQSSPASHFTRRWVCSIASETGRTTLTKDKLIITDRGRRGETPIVGPAMFDQYLKKIFGIVRPAS